MMKSDDLEDLIALGRRGELGDGDERRLRELVAASPEAHALYEAGRAFDADAPVEAGDERTVARIVTAVERRVRRSERTQPRWLPRLLFAALLLSGAAVAAVEYREVISRPAEPPVEEPAPAPVSEIKHVHGHGMRAPASAPLVPPSEEVAPAPEPEPLAPAPVAPVAVEPAIPAPAHAPRHVAPRAAIAPVEEPKVEVPAPPVETTPPVAEPVAPASIPTLALQTETALTLFTAGNRARVQGDTHEAIARLRDLEQRFPTSKEAVAAHLSLGMLYLQDHQPALALDEFHSYRGAGVTTMMAEALWGESQALRALGRDADERSSLEELLRAFPQSAYATAASKRLGELHR